MKDTMINIDLECLEAHACMVQQGRVYAKWGLQRDLRILQLARKRFDNYSVHERLQK